MSRSVLMIHGNWGGAWYWQPYRDWLGARGWTCRATTLPFHDTMPHATPDPRLGRTSLFDHAHWLVAEPGWETIAAAVADWMDSLAPD